MSYFIGIDGGGTKTEIILADGSGRVLVRLHGNPTNPASGGGVDKILVHLAELIAQAISAAGLRTNEQYYIFAGISGMGATHLRERGIRFLQEHFPNSRIGWVHDGINALYSGTFGESGGVLISGTGSLAFGLDADGRRIRIGGWGHWLGDEGSGFSMGRLALKKIMEAWDGRGPKTALTEKVLTYWSLRTPEEIPGYIDGNEAKQRIAGIVPVVLEAAGEKDPVANMVVEEVGREQAALVRELAERLSGSGNRNRTPIVLTGGLFQEPEWFIPVIRVQLPSSIAHRVELILPNLPPVAGALAAACKLASMPKEEIKRVVSLALREGEKRDDK